MYCVPLQVVAQLLELWLPGVSWVLLTWPLRRKNKLVRQNIWSAYLVKFYTMYVIHYIGKFIIQINLSSTCVHDMKLVLDRELFTVTCSILCLIES
jgi:hypothetical protein